MRGVASAAAARRKRSAARATSASLMRSECMAPPMHIALGPESILPGGAAQPVWGLLTTEQVFQMAAAPTVWDPRARPSPADRQTGRAQHPPDIALTRRTHSVLAFTPGRVGPCAPGR